METAMPAFAYAVVDFIIINGILLLVAGWLYPTQDDKVFMFTRHIGARYTLIVRY